MIETILSRIFVNQWVVLIVVTCWLVGTAELGFRLARLNHKHHPEASQVELGNVQGAVLALLGLLLGFSFAMAVGRYDSRRSLVVDEANSIGTSWLRADFLPIAHATEVKSLLQHYTQLKLEAFGMAHRPAIVIDAREIRKIHQALWAHASAAAAEQPSPIIASFITSLNETLDLDSSRSAAARNRIPGLVWLLLLVVASSGIWISSYGNGSNGVRSLFNHLMFPALIGIVITLISDMDRPNKGLIQDNPKSLAELFESMQSGAKPNQ